MEKVVKCNSSQCGQYFMQTKKDTQCPFCHTNYVEVQEKPASSAESSATKNEKKLVVKTQKNSFKIWKNN